MYDATFKMSWICIAFSVVAVIHVHAEVFLQPVANVACNIPSNDSVLSSLKGKLFTYKPEANKTYHFSVCGLSQPLIHEPLILIDGSDPRGTIGFNVSAVQIPPSSDGKLQEPQRILIFNDISSIPSSLQSIYVYIHCGPSETFSALLLNSGNDQKFSIFEIVTPNLCGNNPVLGTGIINVVSVVFLVLLCLGVIFNTVVNKAVRGLSWTESIPLASACCRIRHKCRRSVLRARRAGLTEPRYIRVPMDSPETTTVPTTTAAGPTRLLPRHTASTAQSVLVLDQDPQDECLLSL